MKQYAIGLDNGGTMTKAALFDLSGTELCVAARKTPVCSPQPGYSERDMESLWQANCGRCAGNCRLRARKGTVGSICE